MLAIGLLVAFLKPCPQQSSDTASTDSSSKPSKMKVFSRLPTNIVPLEYKIQLQPYVHPDYFYFDGNVSIKVECREDIDSITLHVNDIIIYNETIDVLRLTSNLSSAASTSIDTDLANLSQDERVEWKASEHDFERQFFVIRLRRKLKRNNVYIVSMSFKGNLNNELVGFYRSTYEDATDRRQR
ncbi:aminopeptidase N-like protein, partial [Leptotrombidium deliense]